MTGVATDRRRLSPHERREQLLELGLTMLSTRSLEQMSVEDIAEAAGVSRGLLFHYFSSKHDFHLAVVQRLSAAMLAATEPDPTLGAVPALRASVASYLAFVSENRAAYVSLLRGSASGDPEMRAVFDRTRTAMAGRTLDAAAAKGLPVTATTALVVRGWIAFTEEVVLSWLTDDQGVPVEKLLDLVVAQLAVPVGV